MQYGPVLFAIAPDKSKGSLIKLFVRVAGNATVDVVRYERITPGGHSLAYRRVYGDAVGASLAIRRNRLNAHDVLNAAQFSLRCRFARGSVHQQTSEDGVTLFLYSRRW